MIHALNLDDVCFYCLDELRRGIPENGICGHEHLLNTMRKARKPTDVPREDARRTTETQDLRETSLTQNLRQTTPKGMSSE